MGHSGPTRSRRRPSWWQPPTRVLVARVSKGRRPRVYPRSICRSNLSREPSAPDQKANQRPERSSKQIQTRGGGAAFALESRADGSATYDAPARSYDRWLALAFGAVAGLAGTAEGSLHKIWDLPAEAACQGATCSINPVWSLGFSRDGRRIAAVFGPSPMDEFLVIVDAHGPQQHPFRLRAELIFLWRSPAGQTNGEIRRPGDSGKTGGQR